MSIIIKLIILISVSFLLVGCTPKIDIKALYPSQITNKKIYSLNVNKFENDRINQTEQIEEQLSNRTINQKKVFKLKDNSFQVDAIIRGKVLESSLNYDVYYRTLEDKSKCKEFSYDKKTKTKNCITYYKKVIPCEKREYIVKTNIKVIEGTSNNILFSKIYKNTKNTDECFEDHYIYNNFHRDKKEINSNLAQQIAYEFLIDISPHYKYYKLEIIDEINQIKLSNKEEKLFSHAIDLIDDKNYNLAKIQLEKLNDKLHSKSWEVLYNLGLIYESLDNLENAKSSYEKAINIELKDEDFILVQNAIKRVEKNIKEKIKAISQLPYTFD